jgi:hypothetical protein
MFIMSWSLFEGKDLTIFKDMHEARQVSSKRGYEDLLRMLSEAKAHDVSGRQEEECRSAEGSLGESEDDESCLVFVVPTNKGMPPGMPFFFCPGLPVMVPITAV